jgi:cytochrome c6
MTAMAQKSAHPWRVSFTMWPKVYVRPAPRMKKQLNANNVRTEADIIKIMRNPGPGMTAFDQKTISDAEAKVIATYILKTFK